MDVLIRPKCWGIGLGRTGTMTLCAALRILGYRRVRHNPPFEILKDLNGGADNGVLIFYKYLDYIFPGSKFVLTLRDLPTWLDSMQHIAEVHAVTPGDNGKAVMRRMLVYESVVFDREKYTEAYHRHHADVRRYFRNRPADLLEINFADGNQWPKLCEFLQLPIPSEPFPHLHKRE